MRVRDNGKQCGELLSSGLKQRGIKMTWRSTLGRELRPDKRILPSDDVGVGDPRRIIVSEVIGQFREDALPTVCRGGEGGIRTLETPQRA